MYEPNRNATATMPDMTPIAAHPYPLELKHHDLLKQEIKNLLDAGIIYESMSPQAQSQSLKAYPRGFMTTISTMH